VPASAFAAATFTSLGGVAEPAGPVAGSYLRSSPKDYVTRGGTFSFTISYADGSGIDLASLSDTNLLVTGPNAFSEPAQLLRASRRSRGTVVLATYRVTAPASHWSRDNIGTYTISLQPNQVMDAAGQTAIGGILGNFSVLV